MRYAVFLLGSLVATIAAAPSSPSAVEHVVHEKRPQKPHMWTKRNSVPQDVTLPIRIGLKQANLHRGHDLLMDVSSHDSPNYGRYYTADEVNELFAPEPNTIEAVRDWLVASGIEPDRISQSANRGWLAFDAHASEAEQLLKTEFYFYEHDVSGDVNIGCDQYYTPSTVTQHVDYITPGIRLLSTGQGHGSKARRALEKRGFQGSGKLSNPANLRKVSSDVADAVATDPLSSCDQVITPACVAALYNITAATKANPDNKLGMYETSDVYAQKDMDLFFANVFPSIPQGTHPELRSVDGGLAPYESYPPDEPLFFPGLESVLDFQLAYPIIWPQGLVLFQVDDYYYTEKQYPYYQGLFNNFLDAIDGSYCSYSFDGETGNNPEYDAPYPDEHPGGYSGDLMCGVYKPTNVISISYGHNEHDLSLTYQERQCHEFLKLGMQGVSVVVASGDSGVRGQIQAVNQTGCLVDGSVFNPSYPSTCPYLTTVGAVSLPKGADASRDEEVATFSFPSGGGFSNIYHAPGYQSQAVSDYFTKYAPAAVTSLPFYSTTQNKSIGDGGVYNRIGRGYPDVSAVGDNIFIYWNGTSMTDRGTSASAPVFASILNRINEERISLGKSTVGFVNPILYAHPGVLHDITVGNNSACDGKGFFASKGWDPVTGLGTPNYPAMLELFKSLP